MANVKCCVKNCDQQATKGWTKGRPMCNPHYIRWRQHGDPLAGRKPDGYWHSWLQDLVDNPRDECVTFPGCRDANGYGKIGVDWTHRIACELMHGPIPADKQVAAHSCHKGHEGCVNPHHLEWKTHSENMQDTIAQGNHANMYGPTGN